MHSGRLHYPDHQWCQSLTQQCIHMVAVTEVNSLSLAGIDRLSYFDEAREAKSNLSKLHGKTVAALKRHDKNFSENGQRDKPRQQHGKQR